MAAKFPGPNIVEEVQQASPPSASIRMCNLTVEDKTQIIPTISCNKQKEGVKEVQQASQNAASMRMCDLRLEDKTKITPTISSNNQKEDGDGTDKFSVGKWLGKGASASVYVHYDDRTKKKLAVKQVDLKLDKYMKTKKEREAPYAEVLLMRKLKHDRIVEYVKSEKLLCIYLELMCGGSVKEQLDKAKEGLSEATTKRYTKQLLEGLSYIHDCGIMHLDVKNANLLCDDTTEIIKISDFGVSKPIHEPNMYPNKKPGTPQFMAPELLKRDDYCEKADIWSTGASVVEMLTKYPPWPGCEYQAVMFKTASLERAEYTLEQSTSKDARDFLDQAFNPDEKQRPSAKELLDHQWLRETIIAK